MLSLTETLESTDTDQFSPKEFNLFCKYSVEVFDFLILLKFEISKIPEIVACSNK